MLRLLLLFAVIASSACEPDVKPAPEADAPGADKRAPTPSKEKPQPEPPPTKEAIEPRSVEHLRLVQEPDDASGFTWQLMDGDEPAAIENELAARLEGASSAALLHDNHVLLWQEGDVVFAQALGGTEAKKLVTFFPGADVSELYVAPSPRRVAIVSRNPEKPDYGVKLLTLDIAGDGTLERKRRFDLDPPPLIRCASRCAPSEVVFDAQDVVRYLVRGGPEDPSDDAGEPVYETIAVR